MIGRPLFDRVIAVSVGDRQWRDLRITFTLKRSARSKPNPAQISIYNLSADSRRVISERLVPVTLIAGYSGNAGIIFNGQVDAVQHERSGTEWVSTIYAADGRSAWQAFASKSWKGGTPWRDVVTELTGQMGIVAPPAALAAVKGTSRRGFAVSGYAHREMDLLMASLGLQWSIQDGALQVTAPGAGTIDEVIKLAPDTGLVGSPELTDPKIHRTAGDGKAGGSRVKRSAVRCRALLQPGLAQPARRVHLSSEVASGTYRIDNVDLRGDNFGGEMLADLALSALL